MSTRSITVVVLALVFGGSAAIMVRQFALSGASAPADVETVQVLVASEKIPRGKSITKEMLVEKAMRKEDLPEGTLTIEQVEDVIGMKSIATIALNEPIMPSKYTKQDILPISPGNVAVSLTTSSIEASNGGLLRPGDYVDLVFVPTDQSAGGAPETILYAKRIIAVNMSIVPPSEDSSETDVEFTRISSVTLDVLPKNAEFLFHMQRRGTINLALRSRPDALEMLTVSQKDSKSVYREQFDEQTSKVTEETTTENTDEPRIAILVASRAIGVGEKITPTSFEVAHKLKADVIEGSLLAHESDDIEGAYALASAVRGEPLLKTRFSRVGSFSHLLKKGMVAFKFTSSDGSFLSFAPEDKLEIVFTPNANYMTRHDARDNDRRDTPPVSITLMHGVRIVAVNDRVDRVAGQASSVQSIVLEVTSSESKMLSFAKKNGTLQTTLLSIEDDIERTSVTLDEINPKMPEIEKPENLKVVEASALLPHRDELIIIRELRNTSLGTTTLQPIAPQATSP